MPISTAENGDAATPSPRHTAQQETFASVRLLERPGADLDSHTTCDLRHGAQQGQRSIVVGDGLVGDASYAALDELVRQLLGRGEVQVGVENQTLAEEAELVGQRLLDLDDHVRGPGLLGGGDDAGPGCDILLIAETRANAGLGLHDHLVTSPHQGAHTGWLCTDAVLMFLDLFGYSDTHG
jgi:hypothetical protein